MTRSQIIIAQLICKSAHSRIRRFFHPFIAIVRRMVVTRARILFGPMKGFSFMGMDGYELVTLLGTYELHVQQAMIDHLRGGDIFYDIGAHSGYFSLLGVKLVGSEGLVYGFEPLPQNAERFQRVMLRNHVSNYSLVPKAVSDVSGQAILWLGDGGNTYRQSLIQRKSDENRRQLTVCATTLNEFVEEHRWPDLIKVDVEGAESHVLEGASHLLSSRLAPVWVIETHSVESERSVMELLASYDYCTRTLKSPNPRQESYPRHLLAWKGHSK